MPFVLAVDCDGTIFNDNDCAVVKKDIVKKLKEFKENGASLILWTCKEGDLLEDAIEKCKGIGLEFDSANENPPCQQKYLKEKKAEGKILATRKVMADFYLDDRAFNLDFFLKINVKETCRKFENR